MPANITIKTIESAIAGFKLYDNSACYEFLKNKKYHSCWLRWIPCEQQVRTYIKMSVFNEMLNQNLLREYYKEETDNHIHRYYVLK